MGKCSMGIYVCTESRNGMHCTIEAFLIIVYTVVVSIGGFALNKYRLIQVGT